MMPQEMEPREHNNTFAYDRYSFAEPSIPATPEIDLEVSDKSSSTIADPNLEAASRTHTTKTTSRTHATKTNRRKLREIQEEIQRQAVYEDRLWLYISLGLVMLGVVLILLGAVIVSTTSNLTLAITSGTSGLIIDAITLLVLGPRREVRERADVISERIDRNKRLEFLEYIIDTTEGETKKFAMEAYIQLQQFAPLQSTSTTAMPKKSLLARKERSQQKKSQPTNK